MNARSGTRILVVDDQPTDRELLVRSFAQQGFETTLAANGDEAARRLAHERFDAVLTDLDGPELNGFELLRNIHLQHPRLPVILMTKLFEERLPELALARLAWGAAGLLRKPLRSEQLFTVVGSALQRARRRVANTIAGEDETALAT